MTDSCATSCVVGTGLASSYPRALPSRRLQPQRRRSEAVIEALFQLISDRALQPGQPLPPERDLSAALDCSRNVLRQAFAVLEERGLITSRRGSGRYMRDVSAELQSRRALSAIEVASIADALETRIVLEEQIAILACQRRTVAESQRLTLLASRLAAWEDNLNFHCGLAAATHNFMLERILRQQIELLGELGQRRHYADPDQVVRAKAEHVEIAAAVVARDGARAGLLVRRHLEQTRSAILG